jgi:hypothetical protein
VAQVVVISRFVCAGSAETGFTVTSSGSCSECSAWKCSGSPMTTELTGSGIRIEVATRGAQPKRDDLLIKTGARQDYRIELCPVPTGATNYRWCWSRSDSASFVPKQFPASSTVQTQAVGWRMLFPSFAPQFGAILLHNPLNVGVNLFRRIVEPTREDWLSPAA